MRSPATLGHVHLTVRDVERAMDFYTTHLGLEVTERVGSFAFLSGGDAHHDLALRELGRDAPPAGDGVGLYHVAFEVADGAAIAAVYDGLCAAGVSVSPVDHGISKALYFDDPDGNGVEVYVDTRSSPDERWRGRSRAFDPGRLTGSEPAGDHRSG